ncbi:uncharacterized protein EI90DRAFT_3035101 [Cantharellus anzutake]|uniref:uncharacterized protein n=1 Tax=Cantharellus anzutake TaxID=1750568 RepID=UPI00190597B0|nr:uncharacterized protein EI90DRAFT_3035101 [Cantharellus anzutake]KAF8340295.1 hypothetical protein EI90DRAFT_3035101 [Cantharellus anzutake]
MLELATRRVPAASVEDTLNERHVLRTGWSTTALPKRMHVPLPQRHRHHCYIAGSSAINHKWWFVHLGTPRSGTSGSTVQVVGSAA